MSVLMWLPSRMSGSAGVAYLRSKFVSNNYYTNPNTRAVETHFKKPKFLGFFKKPKNLKS